MRHLSGVILAASGTPPAPRQREAAIEVDFPEPGPLALGRDPPWAAAGMTYSHPPAKRRPRRGWFILGLLAAVVIVAFWLYREAAAVPEFYAEALARPVSTEPPKVAADRVEQEVLTVQNQLQRAEPWRLVLNEEELNAWLVTELAVKAPHLLPKEVEDPRIVIRDGTVYFACRHQKAFGGVLSIALSASLTDKPNEVAVRVSSFNLGRLPLPQQQYLDQIAEQAARSQISLRWEDENGVAVARIQIPDRFENLRDRTVRVQSLEVRDRELVIQGTAERTK